MSGQSEARNAWVQRVLGLQLGQPAAAEAPQAVSVMKLGKARIEWRDTLAAARQDMQALKQAVAARYRGVEDPGAVVQGALDRLDRTIGELDDRLFQELDAVLTSEAQNRPPLIKVALGTMTAFVQHVTTDPVMAALDGNEILPSTAITGPLRAKLDEIAAAFS